MSGCFRSASVTDEEAVLFFLSHSRASILANESSNALVLLLTLSSSDSPYRSLYYNQTIHRTNVTRLVLKLTPLGPTPATTDLLVENQVIRIAKHADWQNEVHLQKYVFHHTYMIDMQMRAICPNVLSSWIISPSHHATFLDMIDIEEGHPKRKFMKWDLGETHERCRLQPDWKDHEITHKQNIYSFFTATKTRGLNIGCMLMEYLSDSTDMLEYPCTNRNQVSPKKPIEAWGTSERYNEYLYGKAYGLIQYDKCCAIGVRHGDMHWGNMVTYRTPDRELVSSVIDFGLSSMTHFNKMRKRPFNDIDSDPEPPYQPYSYPTRKSSYLHYLLSMDIAEWNDVEQKLPQRLSVNSYKYVPIDLMNQIDSMMIQRGREIREALLRQLDATMSREEWLQYCIEMDRMIHPPLPSIGGYQLIKEYIRTIQAEENCLSLLDVHVPVCILFSNLLPIRNQKRFKTSKKSKKRMIMHRTRRSEPRL